VTGISTTAAPAAFAACAVVPVFNHASRLAGVVHALRAHGLRVLLVDDGSTDESRDLVARLGAEPDTAVLVHPANRGKGAAISTGLLWARTQGYSHVLQVDADGQHDLADVPRLLAAARDRPAALVTGRPVFTSSVPRTRLYLRYLTHFWVWVNTLSLRVPDTLCGFRVYPVRTTCALIERHRIGPRMTFDVEIVVRHFWTGGEVISLPTVVEYHGDGVSHFRLGEDNLRLVHMQARLFGGMLLRLPVLLWRNWQRPAPYQPKPQLRPRE